jgi:hypothetical protein
MAITFPLSLPGTPGNRSIQWLDQGAVGVASSPYTGEQQTTRWPHQSWAVQVTLPAMKEADTGPWIAFFLALNGPEGSFYLGDSARKTPRGTISGTVTVGAGAVANSTTLPISGGAGSFALSDWLQVSSGTTTRLHRVMQVNSGSLDVFPRLRSAYANGTAITYNNAKGIFKLAARVPWMFDERKIAAGVTFSAFESL